MHPMLNIAVRAARAAGKLILRYTEHTDTLKVEAKQPNDFVSDVDRAAEQEIIQIIRKAYPDHAIIAEEGGKIPGNGYVWLIDPLDGTTNFLHGFPHFAVSIALQKQGQLEVAVIYDPVKQELFTAERGGGAQLNNRRLRVSKAIQIQGTLLGTGLPFRPEQDVDASLRILKNMMLPAAGIRRAGAAALDLAYVAAGRLDGYWEDGLYPWDMAAGALLVKEAGGIVTDFYGSEDYLQTGSILAAPPKLHKVMLDILNPGTAR